MEEYLNSEVGKLHVTSDFNFIIYKGFKIIEDPETDNYTLRDVRFNDFYNEVTPRAFNMFLQHGFVKGADLIMLGRDIMRISRHRSILEMKYQDKENLIKKKSKYSAHKFGVKLDKIKKDIGDNLDALFFYETRKNQVEHKYNIDNEQIYSSN